MVSMVKARCDQWLATTINNNSNAEQLYLIHRPFKLWAPAVYMTLRQPTKDGGFVQSARVHYYDGSVQVYGTFLTWYTVLYNFVQQLSPIPPEARYSFVWCYPIRGLTSRLRYFSVYSLLQLLWRIQSMTRYCYLLHNVIVESKCLSWSTTDRWRIVAGWPNHTYSTDR